MAFVMTDQGGVWIEKWFADMQCECKENAEIAVSNSTICQLSLLSFPLLPTCSQ
jgi:hypothetical protein